MTSSVSRISRSDAQPFAELLNSPTDFNCVFDRLEHIIFWSFAYIDTQLLGHPPEIADQEVRRRFLICERWFRILRGELGFGLIRTLDTLPRALACELLDVQFNPHAEDLTKGWTNHPGTLDQLLAQATKR